MSYLIGDTVRFEYECYNFAGALADPTTVTATVYSYIGQHVLETGAATKDSTGVYHYDYTIPEGPKGDLVCEFSGMLDGTPSLHRVTFEKTWV